MNTVTAQSELTHLPYASFNMKRNLIGLTTSQSMMSWWYDDKWHVKMLFIMSSGANHGGSSVQDMQVAYGDLKARIGTQ